MTARHLRSAVLGTTIALLAMPAMAQQPAAPALSGAAQAPLVPGICVYSSGRSIGASKLGTYVLKRLETIAEQANAEINGERSRLQTDAEALNTQVQGQSIQQTQAEQKALELRQREQQLVNLMQVRQREIDMTQQKAFERIGNETLPLIDEVIKERGCSILFEEQATIYRAMAMDITSQVVAKLDAKIQEFAFDRERLDQQAAAPAVQTPAAARAGPPAPARSGR